MKVGEASTVEELVAEGLVSEHWVPGPATTWRRRAGLHLAGKPGPWHEADVTRFLGVSHGELERAVIAFLCSVAGVEPKRTMQVMTGTKFRSLSRQGPESIRDRRMIDLVVTERPDLEGSAGTPRIAVEAKFDAEVNGGQRYCSNPSHIPRSGIPGEAEPGTYASQLVCYPKGCTHDLLCAGNSVAFIWLGPTAASNVLDVADTYTADVNPRRWNLNGYIADCAEWAPHWRVATWNDLNAAVREHLADKGEPVLLAVARALTRESARRDR